MAAPSNKLFHAIVLGGLALVSHEACGGMTTPSDAGSDAAEEFPSELPVLPDASAQDAFPSELPTFIEAGKTD